MLAAMKAWRVHENGPWRDVLQYEDCDPPNCPSPGVVIEVAAAALNFPDMLAIAGKYQVKPPLPFVPGIEAVGKVVEASPESRFDVGDRVIANNLFGGFGERMAALDQACFPVPEKMTDAHAAALLVVYQTSWVALVDRIDVAEGEWLLVHGGAGGVGSSAIQIGKALGLQVIATASSDSKLEVCRKLGADEVINYRDKDFVTEVKRITAGRGADIIYDPVGGDVFDKSTKCIAFSGRLLVIGFASGRIPSVACNRVLLKNISVVGVHWGAYQFNRPAVLPACHEALCQMYEKGQIEPLIGADLPLAELRKGFEMIEERTATGKIIVRP